MFLETAKRVTKYSSIVFKTYTGLITSYIGKNLRIRSLDSFCMQQMVRVRLPSDE